MKRLQRIVRALAATLVLASSPAAAGWSGCYGELGLGVMVADGRLDASIAGTTLASLDGLGAEGALAGLGIGCDYRFDKVVVGILGRYDVNNAETTLTLPGAGLKLAYEPAWTLAGRVGVLIAPDTLLYGLLGYGQSRAKVTGAGADLATDLKGLVVGGGLERALAGPWHLKVEYAFTRYDAATLFTSGPLAVGLEPDVHVVRGALVYRFGAPWEAAQ